MLSNPLTKSLLHTTDNYIKALEKGGMKTVEDLLFHFPREYEDRTSVLDTFSLVNIKEKNTMILTLVSLGTKKTANNKLLTKAIFEDKNGFLAEGVWFNRKYFSSQMQPSVGKKVIVSGKVKYDYGKVVFQSPDVETDLAKAGGEIVPVYPDVQYIPGKWIAGKIPLLKSYIENLTSQSGRGVGVEANLPDHIIHKYHFISQSEALCKIHFPHNSHDIDEAKRRLAYEELYQINYQAISKKYQSFADSEGKSLAIPMNPERVKMILEKFPFELTDHQKITLFQVLKDMEKTHAMQRLLEGDVGTGKTAVAFIAAIHGILETREETPSPWPSPLEERQQSFSIRKLELTSPGYAFGLAKEFRKSPTDSEERLWKLLRGGKFNNLKIRRQHPIGRYIADFYSEELKLIIELDSRIHDEKIQKEYDLERENLLRSYGLKILRLRNEEILNNTEEYIYSKVQDFISTSPLLQRRGARGEGEVRGGQEKKSIQVAIMAPTEVLARQHFNGMQQILLELGISSHLLVGSTTQKQKEAIKSDLEAGRVDIIVGTHALLQEDVLFQNLGFVVIDEQHRFGVRQREVLEKYASPHPNPLPRREREGSSVLPLARGEIEGGIMPHVLNMTATPIPRTLALTLYGDQDLSIISQYPKGRKEIYTKVAKNDGARQQIERFVRAELEKGRQVFWISPLVEESEKIDLANAIATYESLVDIFSPFQVGLLHGKMKPKEKEYIMQQFKENKIQVLSSTSVVEVGVDVPNATIMCIEGAERFGLSQLHQFRGRVGRGQHQSYCYLFPSKGQYTERLRAMERTNNGFELSEVDLELRGPGEVYGVRQSGLPDLKIADLRDLELVSQIREDIEGMFEKKSVET